MNYYYCYCHYILSFVCLQHQKRKEADRLFEEDQRRLRKEMNAKRAREEAEKLYEVSALYFVGVCINSLVPNLQT